jgi:hypothetical protein
MAFIYGLHDTRQRDAMYMFLNMLIQLPSLALLSLHCVEVRLFYTFNIALCYSIIFKFNLQWTSSKIL